MAARQAQPLHRLDRHDQGLGRIQTARHANDQMAKACGLEPRGQTLNLNVPSLVTVFAQLGGVRRHIGEALDLAHQGEGPGGGLELKLDHVKAGMVPPRPLSRVVPSARAQTLLSNAALINVGQGQGCL